MLLLTAVILLIGFIALSSMVIRVSQLPDETAQDSRRPIDLEALAVAEGVERLLQRTEERVPIVGVAAYAAAVEDSLSSLADLEQGRGFRFAWLPDPAGDTVTCTQTTPDTVRVAVTVTLHDMDTRIQVTVQEDFGAPGDASTCVPP